MERSSTLAGVIFALLGFAIFATHDAIVKGLSETTAVFQIVFFSTLFGFPWASVIVLTDGRKDNFRPRRPFMLVLRTFSGLGSASSAFYAFSVLPLADVYGLIFTTPLLITLFAVPFLGERLGLWRLGAVVLGFVGVLVMLPAEFSQLTLGHLAAFSAAVFGAITGIITRKIGPSEREAVMLIMPMLISLFVLALLLPSSYHPPTLSEFARFATIGGFAFAAQFCIISAYKRSDAAIIAPMQYSQLLWAILYGSLFFDEDISLRKIIGASIIVASGMIILYRETRGTNSDNRPTATFRNFRPDTGRAWFKSKEQT